MRRAALAAIVVAIVGCTNEGQSSKNQSSGGNPSDSRIAVVESSDWTTETSKSGIDGETHIASRIYEFVDRQTQFQVAVSCVAGTGVSEMTVDSYIGDPQNPKEGSAFLMGGLAPFISPVGKAKASDNVVTELGKYLISGNDYNNQLKFNFNNPVAGKIIPEAPGYSAFASTLEEGDVNYAALLLAALPMTIQVKNGAGEFEIEIDRSKELVSTLRACGAGKPLLSASYTARVKVAEQNAAAEVVKNIKNICGYRGVIRDTSEPWLETAEQLSISLDCAEAAPQEFAAFNAKINTYLQTAQEKGITCTREALLRQAAEAGVDDGFLWNSYLQNYCNS